MVLGPARPASASDWPSLGDGRRAEGPVFESRPPPLSRWRDRIGLRHWDGSDGRFLPLVAWDPVALNGAGFVTLALIRLALRTSCGAGKQHAIVGQTEYFKHAVVCDAVYQEMSRASHAVLHRQQPRCMPKVQRPNAWYASNGLGVCR
jgi:hypothetical protein